MTTIAHGPQNFGFDRGSWNSAGQQYQPDPSIEQSGNKNNGNKKLPKWAKVTAGIAAVAAAATFGGLAAKEADRAETVATGEAVPGQQNLDPATMSADAFKYNLTRVQQMDYAGSKLNANIENQTKALNNELNKMGWQDYNYFNRPVVKPSLTNSPQEIWDQETLAAYTVWKTAQDGNATEARKLATAVAEEQEYNDITNTLANGGSAVLEVGAASDASPVITTGEYDGVKANGAGVIKFTKTNVFDGDQVKVIFRYTSGNNADSGRWVLVKTEKL